MRSIDVNLLVRPRLLREIIRHALERTGEINVVHEFCQPGSLLEMSSDDAIVVHWVEAGEREQVPPIWKALFEAQPDRTIVVLELDPDRISIVSAGGSCVTQPLRGAADLVAALRDVAGRPRAAAITTAEPGWQSLEFS